jgi:hypothetical protein
LKVVCWIWENVDNIHISSTFRESWLFPMGLGKNGGDPTARRRRSHDEVLRHAQEIVRLRGEGWHVRAIARELGLSRGSVNNVLLQYEAALAGSEDDDLQAENHALVTKYGAGVDGDFSVDDADPVLVAELRASGVDLEDAETLEALALVTADPNNELARWRLQNSPKTDAWWEGRDPLGRPLSEVAELQAKLDSGWRYHGFAWHPPE